MGGSRKYIQVPEAEEQELTADGIPSEYVQVTDAEGDERMEEGG